MKTFSQVVQATLASVRAQMVASDATNLGASSALLERHARKHAGSSDPVIVGPVIKAVRDEMYYSSIGHGESTSA